MQNTSTRIIDEERDPEVLQIWSKYLLSEVQRLQKVIDKIQEEKAKESQASLSLDIELTKLKKLLFGNKSDKRLEASDRPRDAKDEELLLHSQNLFPELKEEQSKELAEDVICYEAGSEDLIRES